MTGETSDVQWNEIDGVPVVWGQAPGPLRAGLTFRVGSADETLPTSGTTHTLEHLALFGIGRPGDHSNGYVDLTTTNFHTVGEPEEVVGFFARVCDQLVRPPLARLDDERGVLLAETSGRRNGPMETLLMWRYGAADYGLPSLDQFGVRRVDGDGLLAWSRRYFTRQNAVLWLSGPPPAGLRLPLPDGECRLPPDPWRTVLPAYPAWIEGPSDGACFDALLPRSTAGTVLASIMRGRLVDDLRVRRAASYSPTADYQRLTGEVARIVAATDFVPERIGRGASAFLAVLQQLADPVGTRGAATEGEIDEARQLTLREFDHPMRVFGGAVVAGWDLVHGAKPRTLEEALAELRAVDPDQVQQAAAVAWPTTLAAVPASHVPREAPWHAAPLTVVPPVIGKSYQPHGTVEDNPRLIVGAEGLTWQNPSGTAITVRVDQTAAVLRWADGKRVLFASDANPLTIEPSLWQRGAEIVDEIDRRWPIELVVDMGTRPADQIPGRPVGSTLSWLGATWPWLVRLATLIVVLVSLFSGHYLPVLTWLIALAIFETGLRRRQRRRAPQPVVRQERTERVPLEAPPV